MRHHLGIPSTFPGNLTTKTTTTLTLQELVPEPLGGIAYQLRSALSPDELKHSIQAFATSQTYTPNKASSAAAGTPGTDRTSYVVMSSWTKVDCCSLDFGLGLGRPECVRRPRFEPVEGVVYLLPKAMDGVIVAGLCLREDDMEKLRADEEFRRYGRYIG